MPEQIRTLVLQPQEGRLAYTLLRSRGAQWGDVETAPTATEMASMDDVVSDLASGRGAAPVDELADRLDLGLHVHRDDDVEFILHGRDEIHHCQAVPFQIMLESGRVAQRYTLFVKRGNLGGNLVIN